MGHVTAIRVETMLAFVNRFTLWFIAATHLSSILNNFTSIII